nr:hypothetical protein MtrunA17_Chr2g0331061 [Ipomoea batatas]
MQLSANATRFSGCGRRVAKPLIKQINHIQLPMRAEIFLMLENGGYMIPFSKSSHVTSAARASEAARSMSSCTRIAPEIIRPKPNPGKI